jgi:hypothetical protein
VKALLGLLLLTSLAHATPGAMITPPNGWAPDPERAAGIAQKEQALKHFGGAKVIVATEAYVPTKPGVALFVTRVTSETLLGSQPAAARIAVDEFFASHPRPYDQRDDYDAKLKQFVVHTETADMTVGTQTVNRMVIVFDQTRVIAVRGDCLSADKAEGGDVNACTQALWTLDPGIPLDQRIAVTVADAAPPAVPEPPRDLPQQPSITDGQNVHLSPITIAQSKPDPDRRPIYLGAGIVVLAAVFWWNRRQRERFDREDAAGGSRREREPSRSDDDADDLAAAARGDEPKDEA